MLAPFGHFGALLNANLHAASKIATLTLEASQKLFALRAKTYMDVFAGGTMLEQVSSLGADPSQLAAEGQGIIERRVRAVSENGQKMAEITRQYFTELAKTQTEVMQIIGGQLSRFTETTRENMEDMVDTSIRSAEKASNAGLRSMKDTGSAYEDARPARDRQKK